MSVKPARDIDQELIVLSDKESPGLYIIRYKTAGTLPKFLSGKFSTIIAAKKRIKCYVERPKPQPIEYTHQKKISDEEEAELFKDVERKVEAENNGKKCNKTTKNKARAK